MHLLPAVDPAHSTAQPLPAAENIRTIGELERQSAREKTWDERLSERISDFVGSLKFVVLHVAWFTGWAAWNAFAPDTLRFDPYPYGLLTFIVSLEGVLVATFVLITQNRMSRDSERRAHLNLQVDLLAEQELTMLLRIVGDIAQRLDIPVHQNDRRAEALMRETNAYELMEGVKHTLKSDRDTARDEKP
jgi:uncharacterized membrane protein